VAVGRIDVSFLPSFLPSLLPSCIEDHHAVVIDVLRASTTMLHALAAGAQAIMPCLEIEDALAAKAKDPLLLLGGERGGERIAGFDFGNSPFDYSAEAVANRRVAFTTTNGTRALAACRNAKDTIVATFNNLSAAAAYLESHATNVQLVCAGTAGLVSIEDMLFAGAMVFRLATNGRIATNQRSEIGGDPAVGIQLTDSAAMAFMAWESIRSNPHPSALLHAFQRGAGGRNLQRLEQHADIELAAQLDIVDVVPRFRAGQVTA
jgi:2-phosphosulfolactate phosphatase